MGINIVLSEHKPADSGMARKEPHELFVLDSLFHFLPQSSLRGSLCKGILRERGLAWRHWFAVCLFPVVVNKEVFGVTRAAWRNQGTLQLGIWLGR